MATRKLIRMAALRQKLGGVAVSTVYRWMDESGLPRPIPLGRNTGAWDEAEVDAWINARAANRMRSDAVVLSEKQ